MSNRKPIPTRIDNRPREMLKNARTPDEELPEAEGDAVAAEPAPSDKLDAIRELARDQVRLKRAVARAQEELDGLKASLNANKTDLLPKAMAKVDMRHFELANGFAVDVEEIISASIPNPDDYRKYKTPEQKADARARYDAGIGYMDEKAPSLVKTTFTVEFGRDEDAEVKAFLRSIEKRKKKLKWSLKRGVHAQTLGKWAREELAAGREVDGDKIGLHRISVAEVVMPKE